MTNDALKMPDEIYLLHNEGDMGEHLWCENIPNDEMEFTKYIRADRAALAQAPKADVEALDAFNWLKSMGMISFNDTGFNKGVSVIVYGEQLKLVEDFLNGKK